MDFQSGPARPGLAATRPDTMRELMPFPTDGHVQDLSIAHGQP